MEQLDLLGGEPASPARTQLGFTRQGARLRELEKEHERLLRKVGAARAAHEHAVQEHRHAAESMAAQMQPIVEQVLGLDRELHVLFQEILADPKRAKRAKRAVQNAYRTLQEQGTLTPASLEADPRATSDGADGWPTDDDGSFPPFMNAAAPESAERPTDRGALRALFRRLAETLHPDKARDDETRATRTEAMKEVTAAYHDGDYARLIEIERRAANEAQAARGAGDPDDLERRCALVVMSNQALGAQLKAIQRDTRELRRSPSYAMVNALKRPGGKQTLLEQGREEIEALRELRDFVRSFRDGKISLEEFKAGPGESEVEDFDVFLDQLEAELAQAFTASPPRGRRKRSRGRRA